MIKSKRLKAGDKVAIVSLSWGGLGDEPLIHKYDIAKERLENEFGLEVMPMPHALKGTEFVASHPELWALDLMNAFKDRSISAVFCAIGGDDTIRILPFVDLEVLKNNPKIFMGYSDSTINHFMIYKAGLVSFYGPSVMCEFGEYVSMFEYTRDAVRTILFGKTASHQIVPCPQWSADYIPWQLENVQVKRSLVSDQHGYEVLQGEGKACGHLLGGCLDVFIMCIGTSVWPPINDWKDAILFIETSEDKPEPDFVKLTMRNLAAQGIFKVLQGIIVGKPQGEKYYDEYKAAILLVVAEEEKLAGLPIFYNVNFGHAIPIGVLPYGIMTELNCQAKTITLMENATV